MTYILMTHILWIKVLHIVAVIAWMAGHLYLPRLFVYHADTEAGSEASETFKVMERRLLRVIMTPAMLVSWISGIALLVASEQWQEGWFLAKLALVVLLSIQHGMAALWRRELERNLRLRSPRFYRIANEIPTLLMVAIVILVVIKPF